MLAYLMALAFTIGVLATLFGVVYTITLIGQWYMHGHWVRATLTLLAGIVVIPSIVLYFTVGL